MAKWFLVIYLMEQVKKGVLIAIKKGIADTLQEFAQENIAKGSLIKSDGFSAHKNFNDEAYDHHIENVDPEEKPEHLKWLYGQFQMQNHLF